MSEDHVPIHPMHPPVPHYYGDAVRVLFVAAAVLILLAEFFSSGFPFPLGATLLIVAGLVVIAGITNPVQIWIQWVNVGAAILGLALFGDIALVDVRSHIAFMESLYPALVTLVFVGALYFSTRTLRGLMIHRTAITDYV
jgi:hypothetical protein